MSSPRQNRVLGSGMESSAAGLFDQMNLDDPYPRYAQLREAGRVLHFPLGGGMAPWVISGYDEVYEALREVRFSSSRASSGIALRGSGEPGDACAPPPADLGASMIFSDPPDHSRLRGLVSKAFTPRRILELRPQLKAIVYELLAPAAARGGIELMEEFAGPLPAAVIGELLGVPRKDLERFRRWSKEILGGAGPMGESRAGPAALALGQYIAGIVAERRKEPKEDLISGMIAAQEGSERLSDTELLSTSVLLLIAGFETTTNLIGNGVLALLRNPDQLERLRQDRDLLPTAIEEFLRYDSPVQLIARRTKEPSPLAGELVPAGATVLLLLGAANRDPRAFPEPDRFDVGRKGSAHLAFGWGIHHCLGAPLARLEAEVAFEALLECFPTWTTDSAAIARRANPMLRGLSRLPLACL